MRLRSNLITCLTLKAQSLLLLLTIQTQYKKATPISFLAVLQIHSTDYVKSGATNMDR